MTKLLSILAIVLGLSACATRSVDPSYTLEPSAKEGVITGSISYSGRFSAYIVHYKNLATGDTGKIQLGESNAMTPFRAKNDLNDKKTFGNVFAITLAPGNYEFFDWTVRSGSATVKTTQPFSIPFQVEAGKLVYVGSFQFAKTAGHGLVVTGATLTFKDERERDLPIMQSKFKNLATQPVVSTVDSGTQMLDLGGPSIVRFESTMMPIVR